MPHAATVNDYRVALSTPAARGPVLTSVLARFPIAMVGLSLLLYVQEATRSFAVAGLVSAGLLTGNAVGSVVQGRLMDRFGPSRPLVGTATLFAMFVAVVVLAVEDGAAKPVVAAAAVAVGVTQPMVGSASRALWSLLLPPGPARHAAYSYEAVSIEVFFILGPGISGLLTRAPWPGTGLVVGGACMTFGTLGFALTPTVWRWRPTTGVERRSRLLGVLAGAGMRTVALAVLGFGVIIGFVEVAVAAAATNAGVPAMSGVLLGLWSVSSVISGLLYGARPWPRPIHLRLPLLLAGFAAVMPLLAASSTLLELAGAMLVAGTLVTPQATAHSAALEQVSPPGRAGEAFGWVITAVTLGVAAGQSGSGQLVERFGPSAAFVAATVLGLAIAVLVWLFRRTVAHGLPEPAQPSEPAVVA